MGDDALRDGNAEHLSFAVDPRCAPEWIGIHHPHDQPTNLGSCGGPPDDGDVISTNPAQNLRNRSRCQRVTVSGLDLQQWTAPTTTGGERYRIPRCWIWRLVEPQPQELNRWQPACNFGRIGIAHSISPDAARHGHGAIMDLGI